MKVYVREEAECPFYMGETDKAIICEGITDSSLIYVAGRKARIYCQGDWRRCQIARMNWARYDDLENLRYMKTGNNNVSGLAGVTARDRHFYLRELKQETAD